MRILFLRTRGEFAFGSPFYFHNFEKTVGKLADCVWAGPGWPLYKEGETVDQTVKRLYGGDSPDWVIDRERIEKLDPNRDYMVGHNLTDLHGRGGAGIRKDPVKLLKLINSIGYDAVFMRTLHIYNANIPPTYFIDHLEPAWYFVPYSIDSKSFYPRFPKTWDITLIGAIRGVYPFRQHVWKHLPRFCEQHGFKPLLIDKGPSPTWDAAKNENNPKYYIRGRYAEAVGRSRFFIFCGGIHGYPVQKYFEVPASGCLPVAQKLKGIGEDLGFIDGETYVEATIRNWEEKVLYYHKNNDEAQRIIENGRKLILKRHTHEIRAREFIETLEIFT